LGQADEDLVEIFRDEASERIDSIVETLLAVESGSASEGAIDSLFRDAHSIKGSAALVGFKAASSLAHAMEDVLDTSRQSADHSLEPKLVSSLLNCVDALKSSIQGGEVVVEEVVKDLQSAAVDSSDSENSKSQSRDSQEQQPSKQKGSAAQTSSRGSIRVKTEKVDRLLDTIGETLTHQRRIENSLSSGSSEVDLADALERSDVLFEELREATIDIRTLPISSITTAYPRAVRDLAAQMGKQVKLEMSGTDTQLDRAILDGISEMLIHILRNSVAHGVELPDQRKAAGKEPEATIALRSWQSGSQVFIELVDDGGGVSEDTLLRAESAGSLTALLTSPGFSTAKGVSDVAGRGVGLDAVYQHVKSLGGTLTIESQPGVGTSVTLAFPLTLSLLHALLFKYGEYTFALPIDSVTETVESGELQTAAGQPILSLREELIPYRSLEDILGFSSQVNLGDQRPTLIVNSIGRKVAIPCTELIGNEEIVVKSLGPVMLGLRGYLGVALTNSDEIAYVLDVSYLTMDSKAESSIKSLEVDGVDQDTQEESDLKSKKHVLIVDDQFTIRKLQATILEAAGYSTVLAEDGIEALKTLQERTDIGLVVTDIEMPKMDGIELIQKIREDRSFLTLPVVVVSSKSSDEDRKRGAEAGADIYMVKDEFTQEKLLDNVRQFIDR